MNELHSPVDIHKWGSKEIISRGNYQMIDPVSLKQIKQINKAIRNGHKQKHTIVVMWKFIIHVLIYTNQLDILASIHQRFQKWLIFLHNRQLAQKVQRQYIIEEKGYNTYTIQWRWYQSFIWFIQCNYTANTEVLQMRNIFRKRYCTQQQKLEVTTNKCLI